MKNYTLFACLTLMLIGITTYSQTTVSLGTLTGSGSTNVLLSTSTTGNRYSRTISIYTASEIVTAGGSAGQILSLAWDKSGTGEYITADAYIKVSLKHVSNAVWGTSPVPNWNTEIVGATDVFTSSTYSIPTGIGWKTLTFTTPFVWNGVDNIAVFVEWDRSSTPTGSINWGRSTTTNANATRVGSASLAALVMLVNANRPLIQFSILSVPITSISVNTAGSVPAIINTSGGNLQMASTILPSNASQAVTWSIVPGTGTASISATGLVTALTDGNVWAKAVSVQDVNQMDSMEITLSNQIVPVTSVSVNTMGSVPAVINTNGGTLQMTSTILPSNANQSVTWSLINGTGNASISLTGLVTAQTNGTVWAKAVSVQDVNQMDSMEITLSNQIVPIISLVVGTMGSVPAVINTNGGTLQMTSTISPLNADQSVTWSVINGTGNASISSTGLVTAQMNGAVWAKAVSVQNATFSDSAEITISNQTSGVQNLDKVASFKLYPNPVSNHNLFIELDEIKINNNTFIEIVDVSGRAVLKEQIKSSPHKVHIGKLNKGQYILYLNSEGRREPKSLIVN